MEATGKDRGLMERFKGTVQWFNNAKGYGFIGREDGGADVFVHYSAVTGEGYKSLQEMTRWSLRLLRDRRGPQAANVPSSSDLLLKMCQVLQGQGKSCQQTTL